ncbi:MAG: DUF2269 family protein [Actinobacteria bacterium]|nr:DUF2269 family protein [Actinomycetota bacterium]
MPDLNGVLKLVHIIAAVFWVGGATMVLWYGSMIRRSEIGTKAAHARMAVAAGRFFAVSAVVALAAGVWMVLRVSAYEFSQAWVSIGFLGIAAGAVLGPAFYGPQGRALVAELEEGDPAASARENRIALVSALEVVLLLVVIWAMVYKPGL